MVGKQFAHYMVLDQAGAGGMGVVYRARDEKLQRDVALKLPAASNILPAEARAKMLAEARAASALNHPNICTIYEVGDWEGQPYIAMEYLGGAPLNERIPAGGLPTDTVLQYGAQIASALECAHTSNVLHRDLKSANVRLSSSGQVKVLDFGLAMSFKESELEGPTKTNLMDSGKVSGTLAYLPPEVLAGEIPDARADIWSLGVLLYEMATGTHPFRGRTGFELTSAILRESPRALPAHVPPGLRAIILHCLAKEPSQRYQRASEVKAALEALHSSGGSAEAFTVPKQPEGFAGVARTRLYPWLGGVAVMVAAVVVFFTVWNRPRAAGPVAGGKLRLLLSTEKNIAGPAISGDGKMLAYVERGEKSDDLYVTRVAGGDRVRLTSDASRKGEPVFSPDGEKIAFARTQPGAATSEICTIPTLGGDVVSVVSNAALPAWSPDGTRLAYVLTKPGQPETLAITSVGGGETRRVLAGDAVFPFFGWSSWSPDGKRIAVSRSRGGDSRQIWLVPADVGEPTQFTEDPDGAASDMPAFSADGRGIVFRSNRGGAGNLWYQDLQSKIARQLTTGPGPDVMPSVTRDGSIAFLNTQNRSVLLRYDLQNAQTQTLLSQSGIFWAPAISPDGAEIAYARGEPDGSWHIWAIPAEGGTTHQLTFGKVSQIYARYTPDGNEVLYSTWGPEPLSIGKLNHKGGPVRAAFPGSTASESYADPSPDGKWLVFARTENKMTFLYIAAADGSGEARRLLPTPGAVPRWSPDGKWIAFSPDRNFSGGVFLVHPDGTGLKRVADRGGWPVWWPSGDKIGMQRVGPEENCEFAVLTLASGEIKVLPGLNLAGMNYPFDVSRDGNWLVTASGQHISDEIWLLEAPK